VNQSTHHTNWIDAWLETQHSWVNRWQAIAIEQRVDATRVAWDTLREHFSPAQMSPEALNVVQSFQSLLQSFMVNAGQLSGVAQQDETASSSPMRQLLDMFPVGPAREQNVLWQKFLKALADYQVRMQAVMRLHGMLIAQSLQAVSQLAQERAAQGDPVAGVRELYELWVQCGEQLFAHQARDPAFIAAQAASTNALSQLKLAQQALIETWLKAYDLPTRSELNSVHLRLRELSQRVGELETQLATAQQSTAKHKRARKFTRKQTGSGDEHA
jgi:class III poly(R)-hydroxyalkanoic acid synthase PhaE subunit